MSFRYRLFMAFMHEAMCVLTEMQGGEAFKKMVPFLSESGDKAFAKLREASGSKDDRHRELMQA